MKLLVRRLNRLGKIINLMLVNKGKRLAIIKFYFLGHSFHPPIIYFYISL